MTDKKFKSDFYLKPLNIKTRSVLATWHEDTDPAIHDLLNGNRTEPVCYSRQRRFDRRYQDCKVVNDNGLLFLFPGDGSKYSVTRVTENNKINDCKVDENDEDNIDTCVVCLEYTKNHIAIPCGHIITCTRCTHKIKELDNRCPLCKVPYNQLLRVFR